MPDQYFFSAQLSPCGQKEGTSTSQQQRNKFESKEPMMKRASFELVCFPYED
jgi:hypothetical protein